MTEKEKKRLDRLASKRTGPRTRTQNLNKVLDNVAPTGITRSPGKCVGCGQPLGEPHLPGCEWEAAS